MLYSINLRYKLLCYNYSLAAKTFFEDYSMIRGLAMDFPMDKAGFDRNDQYLWGPALLINPVTEKGATSRKVHFPKGADWYDLYNGKKISGGLDLVVNAPYERIPVYAKAGAIVPIGQQLQYTTEKKQTVLDLYIYAGADGQFSLYEDEGNNYNYEKGKYSRIDIRYDHNTGTLSLADRIGDFEGMLRNRKFNIIFVNDKNAVGIDSSTRNSTTVAYNGKALQVKLK
ncbi:putative alpha-glucosidase [compost metagenome]